jgi:PAS domain S-box-containing protein/putative nucleotidyltransferase with HDIG domain
MLQDIDRLDLFDAVPAIILMLDETGRILYFNAFMEALGGYSLKEARGKDWFTLFLPEAERERIRQVFAESIGGKPTHGNINAIVTKSGEERLIQWYAQVLNTEKEGLHYLLATGVDITELEHERQLVELSEHKFRTLIDALPQGVFMKAPDLTYVSCNVAHARLLGLDSPKDAIGRRDEEFHPPELAQKYLADDRRVLERGETIDMEETAIVDGCARTVQTVKTPVRAASGDITGVLGIYWDISQRKRAEQALVDSERRFRQLFENMPSAFAVHEIICDGDGKPSDYRFLEVNPAFETLTGMPADGLIGRTVLEVLPATEPHWIDTYGKVALTGEAISFQNYSQSLGRHYDVRAFSPRPGQFATIFSDVTERKAAERELAESEQMHRSLFDHMLNGLAHCRIVIESGRPVDFIYLNVNDNFERLTGLKDVVGRRVSEVIPGIREDDPELIEIYGRVAMGAEPERFETYVKALDMWFSVSVYSPKPEHFVVVFDVITERKKAEIALAHANRALATLGTVNRELVHATDEEKLLQAICTAIVEQRGYRMAWVGYAQDNAARDIEIVASAGVPKDLLAAIRPGWGEDARSVGPSGRAVRTGNTQLSRDIAAEPQHDWKQGMLEAGCASDVALPLTSEAGDVFGVLHVYADEVDAFTDQEIALLEEMAGDLAFGVDVLRVRRERDEALRLSEQHLAMARRNLEQTIASMSKTVEARDPYTAGHQRRVAELAVAIGRRMGLDTDALQGIHLGAMIHDIGKINVPAEILSKPSRLNDMELQMVRTHAKIGYDILKDIDFPWPVAEVAYQHHEHIDGTGYPLGLQREQICLEARIVAVADVVEAMSSHRPYRPGLGHEAAIAEIRDNRGRFYDAAAVDACLGVFADGFGFD